MKRSEMINIISTYITNNVSYYYRSGVNFPEHQASDLLQELEKNGMLPPIRMISDEKWIETDRSWEPEDNKLSEAMTKMDEEGFAFDKPEAILMSPMPPPESFPKFITVKDPGHFPGDSFEYEMTPEALLEQGICPCGSDDCSHCSVTGCPLYCYKELK